MDISENHSSRHIERLEAALKASGMSQTEFSYTHFKDPGVLRRMRKGVRLQQKTINKIDEVVSLYEIGKSS